MTKEEIRAETQRMLAQHARDRIKINQLKAGPLAIQHIPHRTPKATFVKQAEARRQLALIEQQMEERERLLAALIAQEEVTDDES